MIELLSKWPARGPLYDQIGLSGKAFVDATIQEVAERHRIMPDDLIGPRRDRRLFLARAEAMWIVYENTKYSYPQIGRFFNRDHTSVLRACKLHEASLAQQEAA